MATITVRFRGICCFIDPTNGESFKKRVVLPNGGAHQHSDREEHLSIIEYFADDLKNPPEDMRIIEYTRPGDGGQYQGIVIDEPVWIELLGTAPQGTITRGLNLEESLIHLSELVDEDIRLKRTLLGPANRVDPKLVVAVMDLPKGVLMAGPPEPVVTRFPNSPKFSERRAARWLEHITQIEEEEGESVGQFGLRLTPLGKPHPVPKDIWFEKSTRLITIANEPLRFIVGHFVTNPPKPKVSATPQGAMAAVPAPIVKTTGKPTGHFDMYWDLISDPPSRPVPEPSLGTGPGCAPANKP